MSRPDLEIRSLDDWRAHFGEEPMPALLQAHMASSGVVRISDPLDGLHPVDECDPWAPTRGDSADLALDLEDSL